MTLSASDDRAISAKVWTILAWIFAIFLGILATGAVQRESLSRGLVMILAAAAIAPWTASAIGWLFRVKVPGWLRVFSAIILVVSASFIDRTPEHHADKVLQTDHFSADPRGVRLGKMLMKQDFDVYLVGHRSAGNWSEIQQIDVRITPLDLWSAYHENEVSADNRFKDKAIAITGKVESINKDAFGSVYLTLLGGNPFEAVHANLQDESANRAGSILRGDPVELFCEGNGMILGSPMLRQCELKEFVSARGAPSIDDLVERFFRGDKTDLPDNAKIPLGLSYVAGQLLPDDSKCNSDKVEDGQACVAEFKTLPKEQLKTGYEALRKRLPLPALPAESPKTQ